MNIVWTVTTIVALAVLTATNPQQVLSVCVDSGAQALTTSLGLCGVYCLWLGIFRIAEECRLVEKLAECFRPIIKFLYGNVSRAAEQYVALNMSSNLLGVGNAATPSAIAAMRETERTERLSFAGTMLFVVNATGIQLVPTTVMGLRASLGSANPSDILLPNVVATVVTSVVGVLAVMLLYRRKLTHTCCKQNAAQLSAVAQGAFSDCPASQQGVQG